MSFLGDSFKLRRQTESEESRTITSVAGWALCAIAALCFYATYTEGVMSEDFFSLLLTSLGATALAFVCLSPWRKINFIIGGTLVSAVGVWCFIELFDYQYDDYWTAFIWTIVFSLWGASLFAKAFGKTLSGIIKSFFQLNSIKTTGNIAKSIFKFGFWLGMIALIIGLIIALGPLWIIAIVLLLILFVLANK
jgi:hypothetical protein